MKELSPEEESAITFRKPHANFLVSDCFGISDFRHLAASHLVSDRPQIVKDRVEQRTPLETATPGDPPVPFFAPMVRSTNLMLPVTATLAILVEIGHQFEKDRAFGATLVKPQIFPSALAHWARSSG
jgi:hypothetical protein